MTETITIQLPTSEELDLKIKRIPDAARANFAVTAQSNDGVNQSASYTYSAGAAADVVNIDAKRSYNAKRDVTNCSVRLSTMFKTVVTETGETTYDPVDAVIAWNLPGNYSPDSDLVMELVSSAFGIVAQELVGVNDVPTSLVIDAFDHGVVTQLAD